MIHFSICFQECFYFFFSPLGLDGAIHGFFEGEEMVQVLIKHVAHGVGWEVGEIIFSAQDWKAAADLGADSKLHWGQA